MVVVSKLVMFFSFKNTRYMQYLSALTATLSLACAGMALSWPSPSLPKLQSNDSPIGEGVSDDQGSWIVSTFLIASTPVPIIAGWAADKFGRRKTLLLSAVLVLIQWFMVIFAKSVAVIIAARCFGGAGMAISFTVSAIYIGEIAEEDIRGKLSTYLILFKVIGSLIVLSIGPYISYVALGVVCATIPVLFFCSFYFMPETPYYLIRVGDVDGARKNLEILCSNDADKNFIDARMDLIKKTIDKDMENKGSFWEFFTKKEYRYTIFLLFGIKTLQQFSGSSALDAYMQTIIELSDSGLSPEISSIIVGFIQLPAVYLSGILVDKLGRRPLLIFSAVGCAIALGSEGAYFYIQDFLENDTSSIRWLPTTGLALFWIMNPLGVMPLPYVLLGEIFPTNIKETAVSTATLYGGLTSALVSKFFKPLSNSIGIYSVFYIFTGFCVGGAIFVLLFLPETKGKNFLEIQKMLNKKRRRGGANNNDLS